MNGRTPSYYRARLDTFRHFLHEELPGHTEYDTGHKNSPLELLKQGFVHPDIKERFESRIDSFSKLGIKVSDAPLSFTEMCSFNTWFAIHPEKVAGEEAVTTSINFPITIKGTKEDILRVISPKPMEENYNLMVYGKYKNENYKAMDIREGKQVSNLMYATLIPSYKLEQLKTSLLETFGKEKEWAFQIRKAGTNQILFTLDANNDEKAKRMRIAQAKAAAKLKLLQLVELSGANEPYKISVREAKRWVKQGDMFFVVRSWYKDGQIRNKIYEPKDDPYIKFIEVGNGSLILDLDNYKLLWQE